MSHRSEPSPHSPAASSPGDDPLTAIPFTPVATSGRRDGWTPERQHRFIAALSVMGVVARAAKAVGMSAAAAYRLRAREDAEDFAIAWDMAIDRGRDRAYVIAVDRAMNGVTTPIFFKGRQIGTRHHYDNRLLMAALSAPTPPLPR
ncbi:hypothetical protein SAMN05192583_2207 [Sphingomonas gellani]|uniref:Uncharacterized protein n=1 Tax=Sphingomonas gellani TaxID=1166340 RepID=A0A1H8EJK2_9SPHN|nr:hypothetical protein [Sphingomonas gellani]SEN19663.1 hypothetical protein SAMN05192583_2207 [Sphingomonas gellani]